MSALRCLSQIQMSTAWWTDPLLDSRLPTGKRKLTVRVFLSARNIISNGYVGLYFLSEPHPIS